MLFREKRGRTSSYCGRSQVASFFPLTLLPLPLSQPYSFSLSLLVSPQASSELESKMMLPWSKCARSSKYAYISGSSCWRHVLSWDFVWFAQLSLLFVIDQTDYLELALRDPLSKRNNSMNQSTRKSQHKFAARKLTHYGLNAVSIELLDSGTSNYVTGAKGRGNSRSQWSSDRRLGFGFDIWSIQSVGCTLLLTESQSGRFWITFVLKHAFNSIAFENTWCGTVD